MTWDQWLVIGVGLLVIAFIWFAFRQGERVKPSGHEPPQNPYT
jgi:hypothetical protein